MAESYRTCNVDGCARGVLARKMCRLHYDRWRRTGSTESPRRPKAQICDVDGCEKSVAYRRWCRAHYNRWLRHGDPTAGGVPREKRRICSVAGCSARASGKGFCPTHRYRFEAYGDPLIDIHGKQSRLGRICEVDGCDRAVFARDWCNPHYAQWRRGYDPNLTEKKCSQCGGIIDLSVVGASGRKAPTSTLTCDGCVRRSNPITKYRLAERDGTTCGICGDQVDMSVAYPDPETGSVDHVIPIGLGGANTPENCQLAHLRCNVRKNARLDWRPEIAA